jgi:hypothetical protein
VHNAHLFRPNVEAELDSLFCVNGFDVYVFTLTDLVPNEPIVNGKSLTDHERIAACTLFTIVYAEHHIVCCVMHYLNGLCFVVLCKVSIALVLNVLLQVFYVPFSNLEKSVFPN